MRLEADMNLLYSKYLAAYSAPAFQDNAACVCFHALAKSVCTDAFEFLRLIRVLHCHETFIIRGTITPCN